MTDDYSGGGATFDKYLDALSRRFGKAVVLSWMSDLKFERATQDSVTLSTESDLKRDTLDQRYAPVMKEVYCEEIAPIRRLLIIKRDRLSADAAKVRAIPAMDGAGKAAIAGGGAAREAFASYGARKAREESASASLNELLSPIDERSTFERFAVDDSNRMAFAAARQAFVEGAPPDVIYIWGPSGVGKTHLLNAVGNEYCATRGSRGCAYLTYHNLSNACVSAVFSNGIAALHKSLLEKDVILIDDIHLLLGSVRTQTELLNLINVLVPSGRRLVIAGEMSPRKLTENKFNARLADRLAGGLSVPISPGGTGLRAEVLKKRLEGSGARCTVTDEAVAYIAANFPQSMRETLGALNQLLLGYLQKDAVIGAEEAAAALKARLGHSRSAPTLEEAAVVTAEVFGVTLAELKGRGHYQRFARARHAFVMVGRDSLRESFPRIARTLGRDHTTAMSGYRRGQALYERDKSFQEAIKAIRAELGLPAD